MKWKIRTTYSFFDKNDKLLLRHALTSPTVYDVFAEVWHEVATQAHEFYMTYHEAPDVEMVGGHDASTVKFRTYQRFGTIFPYRVEIEVRYIEVE